MRSMRSMRGGFIFRNRGPSLKVLPCVHIYDKSSRFVPTHLDELDADLCRRGEHVVNVKVPLKHVLEHHVSKLLLRYPLKQERPR
jgi:hypothetical protein